MREARLNGASVSTRSPLELPRRYEPLIRWAGSKRALLPKLADFAPNPCARYIEPFAGSAALFLNLKPQSAVLGDINRELINALRVLRRRPTELHKKITSATITESTYYKLRDEDSPKSWLERAARFFVLNRYCFNGLYRTNRQGRFNVPFGPARNGQFPSLDTFCSHAKTLRKAKLVCADFEKVIRENVQAGDFIYVDPPYATASKRTFSQYNPASFSTNDLHRLKDCLDLIERRKATFVLSYADCTEARDVFGEWPRTRVRTLRNISGFSSHRRRVNELLFFSKNHPMAPASK